MDGSIGGEGRYFLSTSEETGGREEQREGAGGEKGKVSPFQHSSVSLSLFAPLPHPFPYQSGHNYADTEQKKTVLAHAACSYMAYEYL